MVRLALIGFGGYGWGLGEWIGRVAAEADCRLVAAADSHLDKFVAKTDKLRADGVEVYGDAMEMLQTLKGRCDGVYIATSIHSHLPLLLAAVQAGYHVHLEKPPAATVQEVDRMIQAVRAAGRVCLVGFQAQHSADMQFIQDRAGAGRLGRARTVSIHAGWPRPTSYYRRNDWAGRLRSGESWVLDGPAMNALAHQIMNMLQSLAPRGVAEPTAVRAELYAARPGVDGHDTAFIGIHVAGGARAYLAISHASETQWAPTMELTAERGAVRWVMGQGATVAGANGAVETCPADTRQHASMVMNFVEAVRKNDPSVVRCTLEHARNMVLAIDGAYESSRQVHRIDQRYTRTEGAGDDARTVVVGVDRVLRLAAEHCCLPSDLPGAPPWAVKTRTFDLKGYGSFPVQFGG